LGFKFLKVKFRVIQKKGEKMSLTGVNKKCQQCSKGCKQYAQTQVQFCRFESKEQKKNGKIAKGDTLAACENAKTAVLGSVF